MKEIDGLLDRKDSRMLSLAEVGSKIYGWNTEDSDVDLRGIHVVSTEELMKIEHTEDVVRKTWGDVDFVSFEIKKAIKLAISGNFNMFETVMADQLYASTGFLSLRGIMKNLDYRRLIVGYRGCAVSNLKKFIKSNNPSYKKDHVKKYLYVIRSLMAGIHILRYDEIEPNIMVLNERFNREIVKVLLRKKRDRELLTKEEGSEVNLLIEELLEEIDEHNVIVDEVDNEEFNNLLVGLRRRNWKEEKR